MQPDRPQLCRFWLAGLANALESATLAEACHALAPLIPFLWRYTWAAVPEPLRARLLAPLKRLNAEAITVANTALSRFDRKGIFACVRAQLYQMHAASLWWVLDGDAAFEAWRRRTGMAVIEFRDGLQSSSVFQNGGPRCVNE